MNLPMALPDQKTLRTNRPSWGAALAMVLSALFGMVCSPAAVAVETNYSGHYELADAKAKADRMFSLDVKQKGDRADVSFSAAMADGSGAAPDGTGKGHVEDGVLSFKFKDSFNNEGTCTLESKPDGFHLTMTVMKVVDPGPFHFYGNIPLKRTADKS
jgi:hypothetical protein